MSKITVSTQHKRASVGTPSYSYDSMRSTWAKCRAIVRGQEAVKLHDELVHDTDHNGNSRNILLPFSPSMTQEQYEFYRDEAELPGITSQYARTMVGALLRKESTLELPEELPNDLREEISNWIRNNFTSDNKSLFHFLDDALWEEMQTSYAWIYVDVPDIDEEVYNDLPEEQKAYIKPYPSLIKAENVINVQRGIHPVTRVPTTIRFITKFYTSDFTDDNPWHPKFISTVRDHFLDSEGYLTINEYRKEDNSVATAEEGEIKDKSLKSDNITEDHGYILYKTYRPERFGERLTRIPAWPLDGESEIEEPILLNFVNREIGLYNKISRRNHLMYGAATYTPIITGVEEEEDQMRITGSGLGTMWFLPQGAEADVLAPPTDALSDMREGIDQTIDELSKLGIRMLAPETSESGVALELRNSSQTANLGTLNMKVSNTIRSIIAFMINWRYKDLEVMPDDLVFAMSKDFSPQAQGEAGMRLVTEWYQMGLIPRSTFIQIAKDNDYIPADYKDEEGLQEIDSDPVSQMARGIMDVGVQE